MSSFREQILPPSMNLLTPVWGYGGKTKDAVTGASLGVVNSSPGPTFEAVRGIPIKVKWQNNIVSPYMFALIQLFIGLTLTKWACLCLLFPPIRRGIQQLKALFPTVTHLHGSENSIGL